MRDGPGRILPLFAACALAFLISLRYYALESHSLGLSSSVKLWLAGVQAGALLAFAFICVRLPESSRLWRWGALAALVFAAVNLPWLHAYFDRPDLKGLDRSGSRDDAVIDAVARLLSGIDPYLAPVSGGAPISPGPGWLLLNSFAFAPTGFALMLPFHASVFVWLAARATGGWKAPAIAIIGCLGSIAVWEDAFGGDLAALGFAVASVGVLCGSAAPSTARIWFCTVIVGLLATARVPLLALPVFVAIVFFWGRGDRRNALVVGAVGIFVALTVHAAFAFGFERDFPYQPAHLISVGVRLFGLPGLAFAAACIVGAIWLLGRTSARGTDPLALYTAGLILTFVPISLAKVAEVGFRLAEAIDWPGYTVVALPTFFYFAARRLESGGAVTQSITRRSV
jgi:hypothetical protein